MIPEEVPALELKAIMLNINPGHNEKLIIEQGVLAEFLSKNQAEAEKRAEAAEAEIERLRRELAKLQ